MVYKKKGKTLIYVYTYNSQHIRGHCFQNVATCTEKNNTKQNGGTISWILFRSNHFQL